MRGLREVADVSVDDDVIGSVHETFLHYIGVDGLKWDPIITDSVQKSNSPRFVTLQDESDDVNTVVSCRKCQNDVLEGR